MSSKKGIENAKIRNAQRIECTCELCGKKFSVCFGVYRRKDFDEVCCKCKLHRTIENRTEEDIARIHQNKVNGWINRNEEEKNKYVQRGKDKWNSLSDEEKDKHAKLSAKNMQNYWDNLSPEVREKRSITNTENLRNYFSKRTKEEENKTRRKMSESGIRRWKEMDPEERERLLELRHLICLEKYTKILKFMIKIDFLQLPVML